MDQEVGAASAQDKNPDQEPPQAPQDKSTEEEKSFRKVGDILERWHRQRKQILDAGEDNDERPQVDDMVSSLNICML